ncbi:hypothetical protein PCASD_20421 [Puccinia coronata f. sp. avenae]|uniref:Uncharacterized protein n=1 Tax=Puccinia coronata f. sp. avenae TaxID=200324 RepID=A0A2N5U1V2_9BASI|nr:hypothetical protein PCASD_20421 [Puccinia coronata f. sp. avenae]
MTNQPSNIPVSAGANTEPVVQVTSSVPVVPTSTSYPVGPAAALAQIFPFPYFALPPNFEFNIRAAPLGLYPPGLKVTGLNYTGGDVLPGLPMTGNYAGNITVVPNPTLPPLPAPPEVSVQNHSYPTAPPQMPAGGSPVFV